MTDQFLLEIGIKLRQIRKSKNLTINSVARAAKVSKGLVSKIENGRTIPSLPVLISIINVQDRSQAEEFRNLMVFVLDTDVIDLPEDTYYHHQIMGIEVVGEFNVKLGIITEIIETGANDVYVVVSPDGKEILIPAIKSVIKEISLEKGILKVELPEWL